MNISVIVQARVNSKRFPKKILQKFKKYSLIQILMIRLKKSKLINSFILACPSQDKNSELKHISKKIKFNFFCGSELDVLDRYYQASKKYNSQVIIRITGDCPFADPVLIDSLIEKFLKNGCNGILSNTKSETFPDGLDVEIFDFNTLKYAWKKAKNKFEREHVTPFMYNSPKIKKIEVTLKQSLGNYRLTIDEESDYFLILKILENFFPNLFFSYQMIIHYLKKNLNLVKINSGYKRNEGANMLVGQKNWNRAKNIILGGNMLLSKKPEYYLPNKWPTYFSKAKDVYVWDLEGRKYADMIFAVGTNTLGYANEEIDDAVIKSIRKSTMSSLNCQEELELAEKILHLHSWIDKVKFARTGGEASAIAIRVARAFTKKTKIAICGYHGWHDWYLSANLKNNKNLKNHLMTDLEINGVPKELTNTVFPFNYNDIDGLEKIIRQNKEIGTIQMEVCRNIPPKKNFLQDVRKIADKNKMVLIFDECTSGFRQNFGGIHEIYNVKPDIVTFGKAISNGYALTVIAGKKDIMNAAEKSFISSTFWGERVGFTAALKTLEVMEKTRSWKKISNIGLKIEKKWNFLSRKHDLPILTSGIPAIKSFTFKSKNHQLYKTFITQEMLKNNYLASNIIYTATVHTDKILKNYFEILDNIFKKIKECEEKNKNIYDLLQSPVSINTFKRFN